MKNRYFDDAILSVLLQPRGWRLIGSPAGDTQPLTSPRHRRWMAAHQHLHPYPEVMIALQGKTVYGLNQSTYPCNPGCVFVIEPNQLHDNGYPPWTPLIQHLWISFVQGKALARIMMVKQRRIRSQGDLHCLLDLEDTVLWRQGTAGAFDAELPPDLIRLRLLAALADLIAALVEEGYRHSVKDHRTAVQKQKIDAICRHVRETGGADASLAHLAQIAGYSKFHFLRLFRQHTGQSVREYVNQARLRKVKAGLAQGTPFKIIAGELGFSCPAAFSRWYRPFRNHP